MCGICGIINYSGGAIEEQDLKRMCSKMIHRGPDREGIHIEEGAVSIGLGHRRLSIIDLSPEADQPFLNEESNVFLVLNGEIYNYRQLREKLKNNRHRFKSDSDSEVALHLYEEKGEEFVKYLRGAFALALWDNRDKKLILARDRVGKKPLVYSNRNGKFCFASEFSALLASNLIQKEINYEAIHYYLSFGYVPAPVSIYRDIFKLLPAQMLILQDGKLRSNIYWDLDHKNKLDITLAEAETALLKELQEAVELRLFSDVPLGVFLSGGIDSSIVVALMARLGKNRIKTFSIGFGEKDYDELGYAGRVAKFFNTEHHEFILKPDALEILPELVERYGEPYADSSCIPSYYVSKAAKKYVTVALNGDGGDESFAGYERYQAVYLSEIYNKVPSLLRQAATASLLKVLPDSLSNKNSYRRARRFLEHASLPFYSRYLHWIRMLSEKEKRILYTDDFNSKVSRYDPADYLKRYARPNDDMELLDRLLYIDIKTNLANDLVVKMDIATMANSLEGRSPFLDQKVMEFCAALPTKFKMRNFSKKFILKRIAGKLIPLQNIKRKKMGFGVPVGYWMRNELRDYLTSNLLSKKAAARGYFDQNVLKNYVYEHTRGLKDHSFGLWSLLMLELWHQKFID